MTKSKGVGRGRKGIPRGPYSVKDGKKLCKGPLHPEGEWLPATEEYFFPRKDDRVVSKNLLLSVCKKCRRYKDAKDKTRGNYGYIQVSRVRFIFLEIENRIGRREAERRMQVGVRKMKNVVEGRQRYLEAHTVQKAITLLRELRETGEVRHREDIKYGRAARGLKETKKVTSKDDLYRPHGDSDTETRKKWKRK